MPPKRDPRYAHWSGYASVQYPMSASERREAEERDAERKRKKKRAKHASLEQAGAVDDYKKRNKGKTTHRSDEAKSTRRSDDGARTLKRRNSAPQLHDAIPLEEQEGRKRKKKKKAQTPTLNYVVPTRGGFAWTLQQELQLHKKITSCANYKWMHYRMARFWAVWTNLFGVPSVILGAIASTTQFVSILSANNDDCTTLTNAEDEGPFSDTLSTLVAITVVLVTILNALQLYYKPGEVAEKHRQTSISYGVLVDTMEDEIATADDEREDGRVFVKDIENEMKTLAQNAPGIPYFVMKRYMSDIQDPKELFRAPRVQWSDTDTTSPDTSPEATSSTPASSPIKGFEDSSPERMSDESSKSEKDPRLTRKLTRAQRALSMKMPKEAMRTSDACTPDIMSVFEERLKQRYNQERSANVTWQMQRASENGLVDGDTTSMPASASTPSTRKTTRRPRKSRP